MRSQQRSLMIILILLALLIAFGSQARPYTPTSQQQIVASWDSQTELQTQDMDLSQRIDKANWHIQQGQYAGQANKHYGRARALLAPLFDDNHNLIAVEQSSFKKSQLNAMWARVLQHQHQFVLAQQLLDQAISLDPKNTNAILLKANVLLAQGSFEQSRQVCTQLLGAADLVITTACVLEANANLDKLTSSYQQLRTLLNNRAAHQQQDWLVQLAADMALRLAQPQAAAQWLELALNQEQPLTNKPLSFIVLWADVQLALQQDDKVLSVLATIVQHAGFKDDALLLRLSLAEKTTSSQYWQNLLAERIELRLARQDSYHSAELARYYLDIQPNAEQALHWAQINWQKAKLPDDKNLLDRALMMQNTDISAS
ncbi:tetratricopeptide repeat protein [Paraglaciecola hydrolytica]|uniref:Tetratricopeptide repeat-like domain-containing protein n=1 Tax=Paraglaciecola hydrolytica TaxID=1799789 RepID=A0A148KM02_9ALTE|nr:tetratricopeptide repeat protein [Paraglaciecola hydrolytica]KXI27278.1 hypothetical protein AX660_21355 [Paraglaciecola hydrolytica]